MTTRALLLAGGLGTRLRPLTNDTPKCLIDVGGRPLLDYWISALEAAGVREVLLNTHHLPDPVRTFMERTNAAGGVQITEAYEPELLGSAGTVSAQRDWADGADDIVIIYADNLSDMNLSEAVSFHRGHGDPMTMALFRTPYPEKCGIAQMDDQQRIVDFVEKPKHPVSDLANAGIYVVTADAWREIADMSAFDFGFDVIPKFVGKMRGFEHGGYHRDIGTPESLQQARQDIGGLKL